MLFTTLLVTFVSTLAGAQPVQDRSTSSLQCTVPANQGANGDSAPAIVAAFKQCGHNTGATRGKVIFTNTTYNILSVMDTRGLSNVDIYLQGTLKWSTDTNYWLANSLDIGYQNQSTAWMFGGNSINWTGNGYGTLDGNGQVWYNLVKGQSNYPNRPHQITIYGTTNSYFSGLRFVQSQMWTMTLFKSQNVVLEDIFVSSKSTTPHIPARNTDGADTMFSDNIIFRRWQVDNGDDSISTKANSTNILIEDSTFSNGLGIAIGSIGQYNGRFETIQNVTVRNSNFIGTNDAVYIKTWTGTPRGVPPNGGGGGLGFVNNLTLTDLTLNNSGTFTVTQCLTYSGQTGGCDTSPFQIRNVNINGWTGTTNTSYIGHIKCSLAAPCTNISIDLGSMHLNDPWTGPVSQFSCHAVGTKIGFTC